MAVSKETQAPINEEGANVRRLVTAGKQTDDLLTSGIGAIRANRLAKRMRTDLTNPTFVKVLGLDKLPQAEEE
jgi:hypothetical protein